jgi:N-terminal domain of toast_rack, DUF2154
MNTTPPSSKGVNQSNRSNRKNQQFVQAIRFTSWAVNLIFLLALIWAIYQAFIGGKQLPAWVWLGVVIVFAAAIGLMVTYIVYRGVVDQVGPLDFRPPAPVTGKLKSETQRIEARGANSLQGEIKMIQGVLRLMGGSQDVLDATYTYDEAEWKPPAIQYNVDSSGLGSFMIEQRDTHRPTMRPGRCEWIIRLNEDQVTELNVKFGAGRADLRLGELKLSRLKVESGVGALFVDLGEDLRQSLQVFIKSGIGETSLRLPQNAGVRLDSTIDFGHIKRHGLIWDGEAYTNTTYGKSPITLDIHIETGLGRIAIV